MKKKSGKVYFNELWGQMTAYLEEFMKSSDQEKLHQFRLQVKKLRALLTLFDASPSKNKLAKDFKPIKKIYKHCGIIREGYINLQMGAHYGLENEEFITTQVNEMEQGISELKDNAKKYLKTIKAVHDELEDNLETIADESINEFYKTQLEQIAAALNKLQFDDTLHNCRKQVKTLLYNRKIAAKALDGKCELDPEEWRNNRASAGFYTPAISRN